jgi:hypothetical protein
LFLMREGLRWIIHTFQSFFSRLPLIQSPTCSSLNATFDFLI